jgi:hypothetical protein
VSKGHAVLKFLRKVHLYIGIFTTPALIFFAFTGAMQTFSLHETTQGSDYKPPAWIAELAQLHKKQTTVVPPRRPRPTTAETAHADGPRDDAGSTGKERGANGSGDAVKAASQAHELAGSPKQAKSGEPLAVPQKSHLPMKIFFLLVAISLLLSTLTGIYMSYKYTRRVWTLTALLLAGVVVPLLLLPF